MIKRVVNISKNQQEAGKWDVIQNTRMSHEERQDVAKELKKRVYGKGKPDVRSYYRTR
ncbi:MAG TPA: hypothetical protein VKA08_16460 [Balneolales bacterium]|nr:hypothetical protein [Balneolales bacterium]